MYKNKTDYSQNQVNLAHKRIIIKEMIKISVIVTSLIFIFILFYFLSPKITTLAVNYAINGKIIDINILTKKYMIKEIVGLLLIAELSIFIYFLHKDHKEISKEEKTPDKKSEKVDISKILNDLDEPHKESLKIQLKILKENYDLGLISEDEYLKSRKKIEKRMR